MKASKIFIDLHELKTNYEWLVDEKNELWLPDMSLVCMCVDCMVWYEVTLNYFECTTTHMHWRKLCVRKNPVKIVSFRPKLRYFSPVIYYIQNPNGASPSQKGGWKCSNLVMLISYDRKSLFFRINWTRKQFPFSRIITWYEIRIWNISSRKKKSQLRYVSRLVKYPFSFLFPYFVPTYYVLLAGILYAEMPCFSRFRVFRTHTHLTCKVHWAMLPGRREAGRDGGREGGRNEEVLFYVSRKCSRMKGGRVGLQGRASLTH